MNAWAGQPRRIRRRLAWAIVVFVASIPLVGFALVGLPHVFRNPVVRNVLTHEAGAAPPDVDAPRFEDAVALLTGTPLTAGHRIDVLANGDATFPPLWADLRRAQRSITVQMYYAQPGVVADSAARILAERARAGVDVYFLYDSFGAQDLPQLYLDSLRAAGVRTAEFRPLVWYALDRANHRSHVRGVVVDGEIAYTGGFGLDDKWLGGGRRSREWRDTNARFTGPAVAQLQSVFVVMWAEATGDLLADDSLLAARKVAVTGTADDSSAHAALLYSPPGQGTTTAERLLALSIAGARRRLYIANAYFVPHPDFVRLLATAARRGVDVRILTNGAQTDVKTTWLAGRSRYEPLLAAGVRIYEYLPTTIHAKTLVADGAWSIVATLNFDNRSLAYNNEVALMARDAKLGAMLDSLFLADLKFAEEIRLDEFRRRPWTSHIMERAASVIAGIL